MTFHKKHRCWCIATLVFAVGLGLFPRLSFGDDIRITSFNIRWYGHTSKGKYEFRDAYIRQYMASEIKNSDVIVFQEIVDVARFKKRVIGNRMYCRTYYHSDQSHQRVVLCHKKHLRFERQWSDNNFKIEAVAKAGSSSAKARPGLWGVLKTKEGRALAHIVGVHLKAFPDETKKRLNQTHAIAKAVNRLNDDVPIIVVGDFNTYESYKTGYYKDDSYLMSDIYRKYSLWLDHLPNQHRFTYRSPEGGQKFDRFWVSASVPVVSPITVGRPCRERRDAPNDKFNSVSYYNYYVSDHCPVSVTLDL